MKKNAPEVEKLFAALVVSQEFRARFFANPRRAMREGYQGETFHTLPRKERKTLKWAARSKNLLETAKRYTR